MASRYFNQHTHNNETNDKPTNNFIVKSTPNRNRAACAGVIFMCDESTKIDCFKYEVLGLSEKKKNVMDMITKGMCLFLFDVDSKLLHGIYSASSCGAFMLEPDAFGGNYPWQVKFHIEKDCLPIKEDIFKAAIKDNYFTAKKFKMELNAEQVQKLVSLFSPLPGRRVQHPRANSSNQCVSPCINAASFTEKTGGHIQDRHTEGYIPPRQTYVNKTVGFIQSDPLSKLNCRPTRTLTDGVTIVSCMHGSHEPTLPLNGAAITECKHGHHAPKAKQGFLPLPFTYEAHKADGFIQNDPTFPSFNCEYRNPPNDGITTVYGYHASQAKHNFLPPTFTCEANNSDGLMQSALPKLYHEPKDPLNEVVLAQKCICNCHIPTDKHEAKCAAAHPHQQCRVDRDAYMRSLPIHRYNHVGPLSGPSDALRATSELQNIKPNHIGIGVDLYPGSSASYVNSSVVRQGHLTSNAVHGNFLYSKLCEGEPMGVSSSMCSHAKIAAKAPGVLNALPGHDFPANLHKRPLQDTYTYDTPVSVFDTSGERPLKCMHHEVHKRPINDTFPNAVDIEAEAYPLCRRFSM